MIRAFILGAFLAVASTTAANAEATLIYDRDGKVRSVVRASPSGFLVYNSDGRVVQAVRETPSTTRRVVEIDHVSITIIGTNLKGGVGSSTAGVGHN